MTETEGENPFRQCLKMSVSSLCTEAGFDSSEAVTVETLTELLQSLIYELGRSARNFCELAGRVEPVVADVVLAMVEMGMSVQGIKVGSFFRLFATKHFLPTLTFLSSYS